MTSWNGPMADQVVADNGDDENDATTGAQNQNTKR
jgi:hypothetical protein